MLRFGPDNGPVAIIALPLFEEANRTRAFAVTICRALATHGVASALPDMPGQGESIAPLETLSVLDMQTAYERAAATVGDGGRPCYGVGIRSGALLDSCGLLFGRWYLSPQGGPALMRELKRVKQAEIGARATLGALWYFDGNLPHDAPDPPVEIAGNRISTALLTDLSVKEPFDQPGIAKRIVRLAGDAGDADRYVVGAPLWRRSEPGNDSVLAQTLARDIADWIAACER